MKKFTAIIMATLLIALICVPLTASAADTNILEGKSYTAKLGEGAAWRLDKEGKPDGYSDGIDCSIQKLTDGIKIEDNDGGQFIEEDGVKFYPVGAINGGLATYVIELGDTYTISSFTLDQYMRPKWGMIEPVSFEYLVSMDGENYTSAGIVLVTDVKTVGTVVINPAVEGEYWNRYDFTLNLTTPVDAKYVKIEANGGKFCWISEIQAMGSLKSGSGDTSDTSTPAATSSDTSSSTSTTGTSSTSNTTSQSPGTGDAGFAAIAIISVISVSAAVIVKKSR